MEGTFAGKKVGGGVGEKNMTGGCGGQFFRGDISVFPYKFSYIKMFLGGVNKIWRGGG